MISLMNTRRQMLVLNLVHEGLRNAGPPHGFVVSTLGVVDEDTRTGVRRPRAVRKMVPTSITFLADETLHGLPNLLLQCGDIKGAITRGHLRVVLQNDDPVPGPKVPTDIAPDLSQLEVVTKPEDQVPAAPAPEGAKDASASSEAPSLAPEAEDAGAPPPRKSRRGV